MKKVRTEATMGKTMKPRSNGLNIPKLEAALAGATQSTWIAGEEREDGTAQVYAPNDGPMRRIVPIAETTRANALAIAEMRGQVDQLIADARTVTVIQGYVSAIREEKFDVDGLMNVLNGLFPDDGSRPTWPNAKGA